jgi:hypothetical protein
MVAVDVRNRTDDPGCCSPPSSGVPARCAIDLPRDRRESALSRRKAELSSGGSSEILFRKERHPWDTLIMLLLEAVGFAVVAMTLSGVFAAGVAHVGAWLLQWSR